MKQPKEKAHKVLGPLLIAVFVVVIILPLLIYGYVYPTAGDDSAQHLLVIDAVSKGEAVNFLYWGQAIVAYPIRFLSKWTEVSTDNLFLWFNYLALIAVGITFYFVLSRLVNRWAGLLAVPITIFCTHSILRQFYFGTIFNIINMYVILPLAIFFAIRWFTEYRLYQALVSLLLFVTFSVFHTTALYLLPFIASFFVVIVVYKLLKRDRTKLVKTACFGACVIGLSLVLVRLLPYSQTLTTQATTRAAGVVTTTPTIASVPTAIAPTSSAVTLGNFLSYGLGPTTLVILCLSIAALIMYRKKLMLTRSSKLFIVALACFAIVLLPASFTQLSDYAYRQALDLSSILAIATACLAGVAMTVDKTKLFTSIVIVLVICGSIPHLISWFGYTSAVRPADMQAIEYVNSLNGDSYSCSDTIKPAIYDRWLEKTYVAEDGDYVLYRSELMTARAYATPCTDKLEDYNGLQLMKKFEDGEIEVYVFKNH